MQAADLTKMLIKAEVAEGDIIKVREGMEEINTLQILRKYINS